ncbi:MAG: caspase family protein [Phycisphaerae bacterium]|nr:caspase family protein [Phycisphaerae bacterium]
MSLVKLARLLAASALAALSASTLIGAEPGGQRHALAVGVKSGNQGQGIETTLHAMVMARMLSDMCGYPPENVHVLTDAVGGTTDSPNRAAILDSAKKIAAQAAPEDVLMMCFLGDAMEIAGQVYLVPAGAPDAEPEHLVGLEDLCKILRGSKTKRRVLVLDVCCAPARPGGAQAPTSRPLDASLAPYAKDLYILANCQPGGPTSNPSADRIDSFVKNFLGGLTGLADMMAPGNRDKRVSLEEVYRFVKARTAAEGGADRGTPVLLPSTGADDAQTQPAPARLCLALRGSGPRRRAASPTSLPSGRALSRHATPSWLRDAPDKHFYCPECDAGFTVPSDKARDLLRAAAKANPGQHPLAQCPKCHKYTCLLGMKCEKCGAYFAMPDRHSGVFPTSWRDQCPKCGHSAQKERAVRAALRMKKEGRYDPEKVPPFIREAVEEAEKSGKYKD